MRLIKRLRSRGGYAMVYVVVAMTLMLAVVGGITATAARNLQTQQSAVSMMVDRYEAAGAVEKKFAEIAEFESGPIPSTEFTLDKNIFNGLHLSNLSISIGIIGVSGTFTGEYSVPKGNISITANFSARFSVEKEPYSESTPAADPPEEPQQYTYTVTVTSVEYQSYNVEYKGAGT